MASTIKAGNWYYRINPSNHKELQRTNVLGQTFFRYAECGGAEIFDLSTKGDDLILETSSGKWCLPKGGMLKRM